MGNLSALTISKKITLVATAVTSLLLSGCSLPLSGGEEVPDTDDIVAGQACWVGSGDSNVDFYWHDDEYPGHLPNGECATEQELADYEVERQQQFEEEERAREAREAAEIAAYEADLQVFYDQLQRRIDPLTDRRLVLEEIVTFYCQTVGMGNSKALWDVTKKAFNHHWRADMETLVPYSLSEAIDPFCTPVPEVKNLKEESVKEFEKPQPAPKA